MTISRAVTAVVVLLVSAGTVLAVSSYLQLQRGTARGTAAGGAILELAPAQIMSRPLWAEAAPAPSPRVRVLLGVESRGAVAGPVSEGPEDVRGASQAEPAGGGGAGWLRSETALQH